MTIKYVTECNDDDIRTILTHHFQHHCVVNWLVRVLSHHNIVGFASNRDTIFESSRRKLHLADSLERAVILEYGLRSDHTLCTVISRIQW